MWLICLLCSLFQFFPCFSGARLFLVGFWYHLIPRAIQGLCDFCRRAQKRCATLGPGLRMLPELSPADAGNWDPKSAKRNGQDDNSKNERNDRRLHRAPGCSRDMLDITWLFRCGFGVVSAWCCGSFGGSSLPDSIRLYCTRLYQTLPLPDSARLPFPVDTVRTRLLRQLFRDAFWGWGRWIRMFQKVMRTNPSSTYANPSVLYCERSVLGIPWLRIFN